MRKNFEHFSFYIIILGHTTRLLYLVSEVKYFNLHVYNPGTADYRLFFYAYFKPGIQCNRSGTIACPRVREKAKIPQERVRDRVTSI